jgi:uncharacterized protein
MASRMSRRQILAGVAGAAFAAPAISEPGGSNRNAAYFEVTHTTLVVPGLDGAHDGLRIAQLSDIHVGPATPDVRVMAAVRCVNEAKPDLVLLTGDFVTRSKKPIRRVSAVLEGLAVPGFAILGNHDHWTDPAAVRRQLEGLGFPVLQNAHTVARFRGAPLTVLGVDDGQTHSDDVAATFRGARKTGTRIVMAHTPPTAMKLPPRENLVCFSGHTHGGQFVVPGITMAMFRAAGQPYVRGLYRVGGNQLYVNRGLGFGRGGPAVRVGSDPEVSFFTLRTSREC